MDARIARDRLQKEALGNRLPTSRTWAEYLWGEAKKQPLAAEDAAQKPFLRVHFAQMLDHTEPPEVFKPSQVAQLLTPEEVKSMGYETWEDAIPAVYHLAFELRAFGDCDILRKGVVIDDDMGVDDLDGPIRIRRVVS